MEVVRSLTLAATSVAMRVCEWDVRSLTLAATSVTMSVCEWDVRSLTLAATYVAMRVCEWDVRSLTLAATSVAMRASEWKPTSALRFGDAWLPIVPLPIVLVVVRVPSRPSIEDEDRFAEDEDDFIRSS